ncbi:MAG TPA: tRNA (adenosine(37)-N6)-threonylcarbamoyltransferase complex dimerization subunit type 1 TsaB [Candidatus Sulfotelmatobacter sp.]|nr:tRNA (adenosine(37)-N6)-threonylcarbamoyltransferase complex dimerization subunit type 1 TsaB [Candidatus Sulfotelmatobacter sp.]
MMLLITDTSGKNGSVALARVETDDKIVVLESVPLAGGTFSAQLVPQIAGLLEKHGLRKTEIDAFIVVSGPGSFTGLRVGLSAIKALAEVLKKPILPVSLLEVIATMSDVRGKVIAALDAGRGEIYTGTYSLAGGTQLESEQLLTGAEFADLVRGNIVASRDAGLAKAANESGAAEVRSVIPDASGIAKSGWSKLRAGFSVTPEELEANYIRRSDAEIFSKSSS